MRSRLYMIQSDGTVQVQLFEREVYEGPHSHGSALCRVSAVGVADEYAEGSPRLPWFRPVDRVRAIRDLKDADRSLLEYVAATPVVDFGKCEWITCQVVRGQEPPYTAVELSDEGGVIWDTTLPIRVDPRSEIRRIDKADLDRKHRARVLLGR